MRVPPARTESLIVLPGHRHGEGFNQATEQYEIAVKQFLSGLAMPQPPTTP